MIIIIINKNDSSNIYYIYTIIYPILNILITISLCHGPGPVAWLVKNRWMWTSSEACGFPGDQSKPLKK